MRRKRHIYRELMDWYRYSSVNTSNSRKLGKDAFIHSEDKDFLSFLAGFLLSEHHYF